MNQIIVNKREIVKVLISYQIKKKTKCSTFKIATLEIFFKITKI